MRDQDKQMKPPHTPARTRDEPNVIDASQYKRCAIYTRKSSEEGLEQDFNSLHAQREACEAYVQSQRHEGWRLLRGTQYDYDDGGLSGGNMERPALQRMLAAIEAGEVDVIVVYKVDRLTRSLTDFARIVDVLDRHQVSFVSVTQAFNTTSSMGRLTLNVLLSFAQFEREVTAERIRDKIAASKRKGIWMGGPVPFGYRSHDKQLLIDEAEAKAVQTVFETYLKTASLIKTKAELDQAGLITRQRDRKAAGQTGGIPFSVTALSAMLRNPVYIGMIRHKDEIFEGQQEAIISREQFEAVRTQLNSATGGNRKKRRNVAGPRGTDTDPTTISGRRLTGRLFDALGNVMSPTHTNKKGVRYRYYHSPSSQRADIDNTPASKAHLGPRRISANKLETAVVAALNGLNDTPHEHQALIDDDKLQDVLRVEVTAQGATVTLADDQRLSRADRRLHVPIDWKKPVRREVHPRSKETAVDKVANRKHRSNERLLKAIAVAHRRYELIKNGDVKTITELASRENCSVRTIRLSLNLAWLCPKVVQAAIDVELDPTLSATVLARTMPNDWQAQCRLVGLKTSIDCSKLQST